MNPYIVYKFKQALYVNLTNRCPNACLFCAKSKGSKTFNGLNLDLEGKEPSSAEVIIEIENYLQQGYIPTEIVFCGYGEPTMALPVLLETAKILTQKYKFPLRLNTLGLGSLVWGRDITSDLALYFDRVNISLNSADETTWLKLVRPQKQYAEKGFLAMQDFIKNCAKKIKNTCVSIVSNQGVDVEKAKALAQTLGAKLFVREYFDEN